MNKTFKKIMCGILISMPLVAKAYVPVIDSTYVHLNLNWQIHDTPTIVIGPHRTPAQVPNVYFNQESSTILFEAPCYECTLELVIPGTETVVYSYSIPDGDDTVQLPDYLSGVYELHIHRGNFCFWGTIEL